MSGATVQKHTPTTLVLNRNHTLVSTKGHVIHFKKGDPTHVPPAVYQEALAIGAQPPEGVEVKIDEPAAKPTVPSDPAAREPAIREAIAKIVEANEREDFTGGGAPTGAAVTRITGFRVQNKEAATVWAKMTAEQTAAKMEEA